jgi:hypothetical protein
MFINSVLAVKRAYRATRGRRNLGGISLRFICPAPGGFVSVTFLFGSAIGPFTRRLMEVMHDDGIIDEATRDKDWLTVQRCS